MSIHPLRRRSYSLAAVPRPSPRLKAAFDDYSRLKAAYEDLLARDADNLVAIEMLLADLRPVEKSLQELLQRSVESTPANSPMRERAAARGESRSRARPAKRSRPR